MQQSAFQLLTVFWYVHLNMCRVVKEGNKMSLTKMQIVIVLVGAGLSDRELPRQVGEGRMVTSGSLSGVMVSTLTQNSVNVD